MGDKKPDQQSDLPLTPGADIRVSGPLDLRLTNIDPKDRRQPLSTDKPSTQLKTEEKSLAPAEKKPEVKEEKQEKEAKLPDVGDRTRFRELMEEFALQINMPDLEIENQTTSTIVMGEEESAVSITIELRLEGELVTFTVLEEQKEMLSADMAARVELISASVEEDGYYLTTSEHTVFLCSTQSVRRATSTRFADSVIEFHKQSLLWRERYRNALKAPVVANQQPPDTANQPAPTPTRTFDPTISASLRISPSKGLKV